MLVALKLEKNLDVTVSFPDQKHLLKFGLIVSSINLGPWLNNRLRIDHSLRDGVKKKKNKKHGIFHVL